MGYIIKSDNGRVLMVDTPDADPELVAAVKGMGELEYIGTCGVVCMWVCM